MATYSLLRNNTEYGPFTVAELNARGLLTSDLVWVEGQSNCWRSAGEFTELKLSIKIPDDSVTSINKLSSASRPSPTYVPGGEKTPKPIPGIFVREPARNKTPDHHSVMPYTEDLAPLYNDEKWEQTGKTQFSFNYNFLSIGILFIGAMMGAFIIKMMIDSFGNERIIAIEAKELDSQKVPISTSTHTAEAASLPSGTELSSTPSPVKRDSLPEKIQPPLKPSIAEVHKIDTVAKKGVLKQPAAELIAAGENEKNGDTKSSSNEEKYAAEEGKKQDSKPSSLKMSANDYKVGIFGGVSGLEISVTNPTSENIENAILEVEFLKPNGTVVKTEILSLKDVAAGASKTITVPSSNRGVKVRYRIVSSNKKDETIATDNM